MFGSGGSFCVIFNVQQLPSQFLQSRRCGGHWLVLPEYDSPCLPLVILREQRTDVAPDMPVAVAFSSHSIADAALHDRPPFCDAIN